MTLFSVIVAELLICWSKLRKNQMSVPVAPFFLALVCKTHGIKLVVLTSACVLSVAFPTIINLVTSLWVGISHDFILNLK